MNLETRNDSNSLKTLKLLKNILIFRGLKILFTFVDQNIRNLSKK